MSRSCEIAQVLSHPLVRALEPKLDELVVFRPLSERLNPGAPYGLRLSAIIAFGKRPHIKSTPSWLMLKEDYMSGTYNRVHTLVVPSSGNTAHAVARLAAAFGIKRVKVILASDVPESKRGIIAGLAGVMVITPEGSKSVEQEALEQAQLPGHYLLDQYNHQSNWRSHMLYTGPAILQACNRDLDYIAVAMGSGGTLTGVSKALKRVNRNMQVIGVQPTTGDRVPGARDALRMANVLNPEFQKMVADAADHLMVGSRKSSFIRMRELWSEVEPQPGPSSGLTYQGLLTWFASLSENEKRKLQGKHAAFICPDDGRFYTERTEGELDPDQGLVN